MKLANYNHRAALVLNNAVADVAIVSKGQFGPDVMSLYNNWDAFTTFAKTVTDTTGPLDIALLRNPVPQPRQVFAIGLNYRAHAEEAGMEIPQVPATFTKFPASLSGPYDDIPIVGDKVDWEVELVAVIGQQAHQVEEADAWSHVAGLTVGQDISDRFLQRAAGGQFSLGKSHRGFGPMGPWLVTTDEFTDANDLVLGCAVDGETVQNARTSDMIFSVPQLVAELSVVLPLLPGDVIFTGTPSGVGMARNPARFLQPGQTLETWVEGIGTMRNPCVAP